MCVGIIKCLNILRSILRLGITKIVYNIFMKLNKFKFHYLYIKNIYTQNVCVWYGFLSIHYNFQYSTFENLIIVDLGIYHMCC